MSLLREDAVVALSTPRGTGAIAIIRISGSEAFNITAKLLPKDSPLPADRRPTLLALTYKKNFLDRALVTYFKAPRSFTGEDIVEISCHGSPYIAERIISALCDAGARRAEPGEFSLRAILNGKMDLLQAEGLNNLIRAQTEYQARSALAQTEGALSNEVRAVKDALVRTLGQLNAAVEFEEEGENFGSAEHTLKNLSEHLSALLKTYERGRILTNGARVAIAGSPNVGKSTLFNSLVGSERAIVTSVPGTTRDAISETIDLDGAAVVLTDTAGRRKARGAIEKESVKRTEREIKSADITLIVLDASRRFSAEDKKFLKRLSARKHLVVLNKIDLPKKINFSEIKKFNPTEISAKTGKNLETLKTAVRNAVIAEEPASDDIFLASARQRDAVKKALSFVNKARETLAARLSEEFVATDILRATQRLSELTGEITSEDVLKYIFGNFCIGK